MSIKFKRLFQAALVGGLIVVSAWILAAANGRGGFLRHQSKATQQTTMSATNGAVALAPPAQVGPAQMVRFTVYDEGIRPSVAHASPGLVAIYLDDKSTHNASLILANEQHPLGTINRETGRLRGHGTILLTAGRYTIYEANRRANAATIVVAP